MRRVARGLARSWVAWPCPGRHPPGRAARAAGPVLPAAGPGGLCRVRRARQPRRPLAEDGGLPRAERDPDRGDARRRSPRSSSGGPWPRRRGTADDGRRAFGPSPGTRPGRGSPSGSSARTATRARVAWASSSGAGRRARSRDVVEKSLSRAAMTGREVARLGREARGPQARRPGAARPAPGPGVVAGGRRPGLQPGLAAGGRPHDRRPRRPPTRRRRSPRAWPPWPASRTASRRSASPSWTVGAGQLAAAVRRVRPRPGHPGRLPLGLPGRGR